VIFSATKSKVANRGRPPDEFLTKLLAWGRAADAEIFAPRPAPKGRPDLDVYAFIVSVLGPWESMLHRRAALIETMLVHAGLESSWNQHEGKDPGNHNPDPKSWETGLFQVSFDSTEIDHNAMLPFAVEHGIGTYGSFISLMKTDINLAFEYYARLVRVSVWWAGPFRRREVQDWLSRPAMKEWMGLLVTPEPFADRDTK